MSLLGKRTTATLMVAAFSSIPGAGFAQQFKFSDIDCGLSKFAVTGGLRCRDTGTYYGGDTARGQFRKYALVSSDVDVVLTMGADYRSYISAVAMTDLRSFDTVAKRGTDWSEPQKAATDVDYMTFHDGKRSCMVFRRNGPHAQMGYAWIVTGMSCAPNNHVLDAAIISAEAERFRPK